MTESPIYVQIVGQNQTQQSFDQVRENIKKLKDDFVRENDNMSNNFKEKLQ